MPSVSAKGGLSSYLLSGVSELVVGQIESLLLDDLGQGGVAVVAGVLWGSGGGGQDQGQD